MLGFLILDKSGFAIFETFTLDFNKLDIKRTRIYDLLKEFTPTRHEYLTEGLILNCIQINEKRFLAILNLEHNIPDETKISKLLDIANRVLEGDKLTIHRLLQANSEEEFLII